MRHTEKKSMNPLLAMGHIVVVLLLVVMVFQLHSLNTAIDALGTAAPAGAEAPSAPTAAAPSAPTAPSIEASAVAELVVEERAKGDADAPVTIIEWADFACGFCGRHYQTTKPQIEENFIDNGQVRYVYKFAPVVGGDKSAEAAACAADQDLFWEAHDLIFQNNAGRATVAELKTLFAQIDGLDQDAFATCLDSGAKTQEVADDFAQAREYGFRGTPFFIVGDTTVAGAQPYAVFEQAINAALAN